MNFINMAYITITLPDCPLRWCKTRCKTSNTLYPVQQKLPLKTSFTVSSVIIYLQL